MKDEEEIYSEEEKFDLLLEELDDLIEELYLFEKDNKFNNEFLIKKCEEIIKIDPKNAYAWKFMGYAYDNLEQFEKAKVFYEKSIEFNNNDAGAWILLGTTYYNLDDEIKAFDCYDKAFKKIENFEPENIKALKYMGEFYLNTFKPEGFKKGINCYKKIVNINPEDDSAWWQLGFLNQQIGNHREAIKSFEECFRISSEIDQFMLSCLASSLYALGNYQKAIQVYEESNEAGDDEEIVYENLLQIVDSYQKLRLWQKAIENYEKMIKIKLENREEVLSEIKKLKIRILKDWNETLPFPLASILWLYFTDINIEHKIDHLFHFFEALTETFVLFILSAFYMDKSFYNSEKYKWIEKKPKNPDWIKTPSFGDWFHIGRRLSKALRSFLSSKNRYDYIEKFRLSGDFLKILSNKDLFSILEKVIKWRNLWKGHGGVASNKEFETRLINLENSLYEIKTIIEDRFENVKLIKSKMI